MTIIEKALVLAYYKKYNEEESYEDLARMIDNAETEFEEDMDITLAMAFREMMK